MRFWFGRKDSKPADKADVSAITVGMSEQEVRSLLGPPHRQTNTDEAFQGMKIVGGKLPQQRFWLYLNQPPGYDTEIALQEDRVVEARQVPTQAKPAASHPDLDGVLGAAESLPAATDDDVQRNFLGIAQTWGAKEILVLSADDLRQRVAKILSDDVANGLTQVKVDTHVNEPPPHVQFNLLGSGHFRPYRIAKRKDGRYALYGHQAMYRQ